jgi:DNA (cytosine-5)-methyltransferase 1
MEQGTPKGASKKVIELKYFSLFTGAGGFEQGLPKDWECVGMSEIDKYANMVLRYHYPKVKNYGDVSEIRWNEIPDFNLLVGGSPCQDVSIAGKRKGINAQRSGLFFQYVKCLKEKNPDYFIWENVAGMLSSNAGWDATRVLLELSQAGYNVEWQILNAKDFGVPQNRERIFITGFRGTSPKEVFFKPKDKGQIVKLQSEGLIATTLTRKNYAAESTGTYIVETERQTQNQLKELTEKQSQGFRIYSTEGISTTIASQAGGLGAKTGLYEVLTPEREHKRQNGRRFKEDGEPMFTLTKQDIHGIAIRGLCTSDTFGALRSGGDGGVPSQRMVNSQMEVRRLIPLECERLMGWEDNWTRYGIDEKGNKIEISDSQRYKLCGNGVVSNVVKELVGVVFG